MYQNPEYSTSTKQTLKYLNRVGIQASIEDLRESSGYSQASIWLFSVELFNQELEKFNLKNKAEIAEQEAAYKKALADNK